MSNHNLSSSNNLTTSNAASQTNNNGSGSNNMNSLNAQTLSQQDAALSSQSRLLNAAQAQPASGVQAASQQSASYGSANGQMSPIRSLMSSNSFRLAMLNTGSAQLRTTNSILGSLNLQLMNLRNPLTAQSLREGRTERNGRMVSSSSSSNSNSNNTGANNNATTFSASQPTTRNSILQNNSAAQIMSAPNRPLVSAAQITSSLSQPLPATNSVLLQQPSQLLPPPPSQQQQSQQSQQPAQFQQQQQLQQLTLELSQSSCDDYIFGSESLATPSENVELVKCAICMHIYQNPIACGNCLNHFCSLCIREWLNRNPRSCPLCKNFREMRCVPMLKNMLDKLTFICSNKAHGCEEIIRYEQVLKHEESCDYRQQVCPIFGCGEKMIKKLIEKHVSEECDYVLASCHWCKVQIKKKQLAEHEDSCDQKEVKCDLCLETFHFKEIQTHDSKCPQKIIPCSWCSKEVKQCELSDHEDCCSERIVRCQGCSYECCLNDHFLHTKSCQEISVFCHRCQTEMKRKEFSSHSLEACIENIHKVNSAKVFQLETENKELKKKLTQTSLENKQEIAKINNVILQMSNFLSWGRPRNTSNRFSVEYKDQDIFVTSCGATALVRDCKKKRRDRFVIVDYPARLLDQPESVTFQIKSRRSEWYAIGICDETNVYSSRRYHDIGHLSYLTSANGILYSSHNPNENWKNTQFKIDQDNIITVNFLVSSGNPQSQMQSQQSASVGNDNSAAVNVLPGMQLLERNRNPPPIASVISLTMQLQFINHSKNQELIINLDPTQIHAGKFYFCACLRCPGDSIEIVQNPGENNARSNNIGMSEQISRENGASSSIDIELNPPLVQSQPLSESSQQAASNSQQQQQQQQQQNVVEQAQGINDGSSHNQNNNSNGGSANISGDQFSLSNRVMNSQMHAPPQNLAEVFNLNGFREMEESDLNTDDEY